MVIVVILLWFMSLTKLMVEIICICSSIIFQIVKFLKSIISCIFSMVEIIRNQHIYYLESFDRGMIVRILSRKEPRQCVLFKTFKNNDLGAFLIGCDKYVIRRGVIKCDFGNPYQISEQMRDDLRFETLACQGLLTRELAAIGYGGMIYWSPQTHWYYSRGIRNGIFYLLILFRRWGQPFYNKGITQVGRTCIIRYAGRAFLGEDWR